MAQSQSQSQSTQYQPPRQYHHAQSSQHTPQYTAGRYQSSASTRQPQPATHSQSTQSLSSSPPKNAVRSSAAGNASDVSHSNNASHAEQGGGAAQLTPQGQPDPEQQLGKALEADGGGGDAECVQETANGGGVGGAKDTASPKKKPKPFSSLSSGPANNRLFGTRYEVKCDETFAYYEGYVFDYDEKEGKLLVAYPWKADQAVPVSYVRPLAPAVEASWKPRQGDHVECQAKAEESEPYGWWDCSIKTVRDNLYLITYEGWDNHHEVLQHNMLRPYNEQPPFEDDGIVRKTVDLSPERIREFRELGQSQQGQTQDLEKAKQLGQLRRIMAQTQLIHLGFSASLEKLVLVGRQRQVADARMLIQFVWGLRRIYRDKEQGVRAAVRARRKEVEQLRGCAEVRFEFDISLTRYVIGPRGDNIQKAKKLEQVRHINVRNVDERTSECIILATSQQAADEARAILEMDQAAEVIPRAVKKDLIGKDGVNIRDLERRSQVIKICTLEHLQHIRERDRERDARDNRDGPSAPLSPRSPLALPALMQPPQDESLCKLIIIGPKEYVPFAKMLIQTQVQHLAQQKDFLQRQHNAQREIASGRGRGASYDAPYEHYEPYDQSYDQGYQQGQAQQSRRRQQKYQQQQLQAQTQQSSRDLSDFDYNNNNGAGRRRRGQNQGKQGDQSNRRDLDNFPPIGGRSKPREANGEHQEATKSRTWNDLDELGDQEQEQEQGQRSARRGVRSGRRNRRARADREPREDAQEMAPQEHDEQATAAKTVWKAKQPSADTDTTDKK